MKRGDLVTIAPLFRVSLAPNATNGLTRNSQVMVDKAVTVTRERVGTVIGRIDEPTLLQVDRLLAVFLGITR